MLGKLGYKFDYRDLEVWELEAYSLIANTVAEEEEKDIKKTRK